MKNKIKYLAISLMIFCLIPSVSASLGGSLSTFIDNRSGIGGTQEAYETSPRTRAFWERDSYVYGYREYNSAGNSIADTRYTNDYGLVWGDASGQIVGCDYSHYPFSNKLIMDVAVDDETYLGHVTACKINPSASPFRITYNNKEMGSIAGVWGLISDSGGNYVELDTSNQYQMSTSITLIDGKPVIVACYWDMTEGYSTLLRAWFSDSVEPNNIGNFTEISYNWGNDFGGYAWGVPHTHTVNSTHVLTLIERDSDFRLFGIYSSAGGFGSSFEIISEDLNAPINTNNWLHSSVSTNSENTLNTSAYAENIAISYVNASGWVKFGIFTPENDTFSTPEIVADNSTATYEPFMTSLGKDEDTYFIGWNGNMNDATDLDFYITERNPSTKLMTTNYIITFNGSISAERRGFSMSKRTFNGSFFVSYLDASDNGWTATIEAEGLDLSPPEDEEETPIDNNLIFIIGGFVSFFTIMFFIIKAKKDMI